MAVSQSQKTLLFSLSIVVALGGGGYFLWSLFHPYRVPTGSMSPAIPAGGFVFVDDFAYSSPDQVKRGDVIVFTAPESFARQTRNKVASIYVFRVVGLPGDTIGYDDSDNYTINGSSIDQSVRGDKVFERQEREWYEISTGGSRPVKGLNTAVIPFEVPQDEFFVSGDNRVDALDSRYWGTVPFELVKGQARVD
ncbi:signal peptidase I [bacterium]|nr:signal peptidase I [bacterium]